MSEKSLYRYRTINKYSIKALMNDEIYATTPNNFNDPYDVIFLYDIDELVKLILLDEELLRNIYLELDHEDLFTFSFESFYFYIKSTPSNSAIEILMNNAIKLFRKKHLIACFSENNKSEIMWAHYSNFGTGFVIKYDSNDLKNMCSEYLQKIDKNLFENPLKKSPPNKLDGEIISNFLFKVKLQLYPRSNAIKQSPLIQGREFAQFFSRIFGYNARLNIFTVN